MICCGEVSSAEVSGKLGAHPHITVVLSTRDWFLILLILWWNFCWDTKSKRCSRGVLDPCCGTDVSWIRCLPANQNVCWITTLPTGEISAQLKHGWWSGLAPGGFWQKCLYRKGNQRNFQFLVFNYLLICGSSNVKEHMGNAWAVRLCHAIPHFQL